MPSDLDVAFVVVQHLSAESKSLMAELFERFTNLKVVALNQRTVCEKNTVYLVPAQTLVTVEAGALVPRQDEVDTSFNYPINFFKIEFM